MQKPQVKYGLEIAFGTTYGPEEEAAVVEAMRNNAPSCGKKVKEFETAFAAFCGVNHALAVTSATTGLTLAGIAAGVLTGDEVITTPISWVSTATAFSALGARIVFCDVDPRTLNLDPRCLEKLITPRTKAIVPVHLFGQCCDMDAIMTIAQRHGIKVIEDCAHCPGAEFNGRKAGSLGDMGVFSFHQQKNMSTLGEGGMVTMNDSDLRDKVLSYRSLCCRIYGPSEKYLSIDESKYPMNQEYWRLMFDDVGFNYRMTDVQAAAGLVQLRRLGDFNARRTSIAGRLSTQLNDIPGLALPWSDPRNLHVWHLFVIQLGPDFGMSKREFMWELCTQKGVRAWSNYTPIHLTGPYLAQGHGTGECPVAEAAHQRYVSLPVYPALTDEAIDYMASSIREVHEHATKSPRHREMQSRGSPSLMRRTLRDGLSK